MIKTILMNLSDVVQDMKTDQRILLAYLGYNLNMAVNHNNYQSYFRGKVEPQEISKQIISFIREFILCPICSLPEIEVNGLHYICWSCGANENLKIKNEKFKKFVVKQFKPDEEPDLTVEERKELEGRISNIDGWSK